MLLAAFAPLAGATGFANSATLAATVAAQTLAIPGGPRFGTQQMRIYNAAGAAAYISIGKLATLVAATVANSMPIAPGAVEIITIDPSADTISIILGLGTGSFTVTIGEGV